MSNAIKTEPVRLAWTNNLRNPDEKFKHSSGSPLYSASMILTPSSLQDLKDKVTQQVGEQYTKAMFIKKLDENRYQVKAKCVAWFENAQGRTYQTPYILDMNGNKTDGPLEGELAIVEIEPKAYPMYRKLGFILKGVQLVEPQPKTKEEVEKEIWGTGSEDHSHSQNGGS